MITFGSPNSHTERKKLLTVIRTCNGDSCSEGLSVRHYLLQANVSLPPSLDRKAMTLGLCTLPWGWHRP